MERLMGSRCQVNRPKKVWSALFTKRLVLIRILYHTLRHMVRARLRVITLSYKVLQMSFVRMDAVRASSTLDLSSRILDTLKVRAGWLV